MQIKLFFFPFAYPWVFIEAEVFDCTHIICTYIQEHIFDTHSFPTVTCLYSVPLFPNLSLDSHYCWKSNVLHLKTRSSLTMVPAKVDGLSFVQSGTWYLIWGEAKVLVSHNFTFTYSTQKWRLDRHSLPLLVINLLK